MAYQNVVASGTRLQHNTMIEASGILAKVVPKAKCTETCPYWLPASQAYRHTRAYGSRTRQGHSLVASSRASPMKQARLEGSTRITFLHTSAAQGAHVWVGQQQAMRCFCALADATRYFCSFAGNRRREVTWKSAQSAQPMVGRAFPTCDPAQPSPPL